MNSKLVTVWRELDEDDQDLGRLKETGPGEVEYTVLDSLEREDDGLFSYPTNIEDVIRIRKNLEKMTEKEKPLVESQLDDDAETDGFNEEYRITFTDYLPLTFVAGNNGLEYKLQEEDVSLSCFSMEDVDIQYILAKKNNANPNQPSKGKSGAVAVNFKGMKTDGPEEDSIQDMRSDVMTLCAKTERNFKEVQSNLFNPSPVIQMGIEAFNWNTNKKKYNRYLEKVPLTREERIRFLIDKHQSDDLLHKNAMLDVKRYIDAADLKPQQLFSRLTYEPPRFGSPTFSQSQLESIPIRESFVMDIQVQLIQAREKCTDRRTCGNDKRLMLSLLERMDRLFMDSLTSLHYHNCLISEDNVEASKRNDCLLQALGGLNKEIATAQKGRTTTHEKILKMKQSRTNLDEELFKKSEHVTAKVEDEKANLRQSERIEAMLRKSHKDKKAMNNKLKNLYEKLSRGLQLNNSQLRGIARGYETKNSLKEIITLKNTPAGRSLSHKKIIFKNRTGLSNNTATKNEEEMFRNQLDMDLLNSQVDTTKRRMWNAETNVKNSDVRVGFTLADPAVYQTRPMSVSRDPGTKRKLMSILDEHLGLPEEEKEQVDSESQGNEPLEGGDDEFPDEMTIQKKPSASKPKPKHTPKPPIKVTPQRAVKEYSPVSKKTTVTRFGEFVDLPVSTKPYTSEAIKSLEPYPLIKANIVNKPENYQQYRMRKDLIPLPPNKCHY